MIRLAVQKKLDTISYKDWNPFILQRSDDLLQRREKHEMKIEIKRKRENWNKSLLGKERPPRNPGGRTAAREDGSSVGKNKTNILNF